MIVSREFDVSILLAIQMNHEYFTEIGFYFLTPIIYDCEIAYDQSWLATCYRKIDMLIYMHVHGPHTL